MAARSRFGIVNGRVENTHRFSWTRRFFSLSRIDLQKLRNSRDKHSESIHAMLDEPRRLIISILCGNELVNIASAANMAAILLMLYGDANVTWFNILIMVPLFVVDR
ncbi:DUF21 domain-containing protein [Candidatus Thiodiazotropha sp. LNASS1]|uniref:DUF21 domain-containing protein n=1 Tax=Candidatus Thiodiazotropha sp. LNASS1 TaxID=3096260 RepID=UPI0034DE031D